ncbi:MAG TPA: NAD-dependent epimerase/dehydratase family protein [Actinomycetes bacterium]|nr:NAD-dependent epimerase/dehydratase family protein [Actinomycetes bacterium]
MRAVVTGAAGFVGSHLCEELLAAGDEVVGIDCFTDFYPARVKKANVAGILSHERFTLHQADLLTAPLAALLAGADVVYHLAGQPGVRPSWGSEFADYMHRNILVTQRLLEALRDVRVWKLVYASSSSVYGNAECYPTAETVRPQPVSPYGVTKLAAEHLCELYRLEHRVPAVSLRLFTVYGPRQRPDMAFSRLVQAALTGETFHVYGDGEQTRDFTYVGDVVRAFRTAAESTWTGVANIGGGSRTSMNQVIRTVSTLVRPVNVVHQAMGRGDVRHTGADTTRAHDAFGYAPQVRLETGLLRMLEAAEPAPTAAAS